MHHQESYIRERNFAKMALKILTQTDRFAVSFLPRIKVRDKLQQESINIPIVRIPAPAFTGVTCLRGNGRMQCRIIV